MPSDDKGRLLITALLLAWLGYRAGSRTQRFSATWGDHKDLRTKTQRYQKLRWEHLKWAVIGWSILVVAALIVLNS
jgi:hypothetical protein